MNNSTLRQYCKMTNLQCIQVSVGAVTQTLGFSFLSAFMGLIGYYSILENVWEVSCSKGFQLQSANGIGNALRVNQQPMLSYFIFQKKTWFFDWENFRFVLIRLLRFTFLRDISGRTLGHLKSWIRRRYRLSLNFWDTLKWDKFHQLTQVLCFVLFMPLSFSGVKMQLCNYKSIKAIHLVGILLLQKALIITSPSGMIVGLPI